MAERVYPSNRPGVQNLNGAYTKGQMYGATLPTFRLTPLKRCRNRCCLCLVAFLLVLILVARIVALVLWVIDSPHQPSFTVNSMQIPKFNVIKDSHLSYEFDLEMDARDPQVWRNGRQINGGFHRQKQSALSIAGCLLIRRFRGKRTACVLIWRFMGKRMTDIRYFRGANVRNQKWEGISERKFRCFSNNIIFFTESPDLKVILQTMWEKIIRRKKPEFQSVEDARRHLQQHLANAS